MPRGRKTTLGDTKSQEQLKAGIQEGEDTDPLSTHYRGDSPYKDEPVRDKRGAFDRLVDTVLGTLEPLSLRKRMDR